MQTIILSASTNKLFLTPEEAEDYAAWVMELLDTEKRGYIEVPFNREIWISEKQKQEYDVYKLFS